MKFIAESATATDKLIYLPKKSDAAVLDGSGLTLADLTADD